MNISSAQSMTQRYNNRKTTGTNTAKREAAQSKNATSSKDLVSLSQQSREASAKSRELQKIEPVTVKLTGNNNNSTSFGFHGMSFTTRSWQGQQTAAEAATGYKFYTEPGRVTNEVDQHLACERDSLGTKIDKALKNSGIELGDDDKLKFTVGKDGKISVDPNGLSKKNKNNASAIEEALNATPGLAKELYINSAAQQTNNGQRKAEESMYSIGSGDAMEAAAHRESVDSWLRDTLGFGIDELEAEGWGGDDSLYGEYRQAYSEYTNEQLSWNDTINLNQTINGIIENSKTFGNVEYEASFTFQAGALTDNRAGTTNNTPGQAKSNEEIADTADKVTGRQDAVAADGSDGEKTDLNTAIDDFKNEFKAAFGLSQPFGLQLQNGMFSLRNAAFLGTGSRNGVISIINQLNNNTLNPSSDLAKSAQTLRESGAGNGALNISF